MASKWQQSGFSTRRLIIALGVIMIIGLVLLSVWGLGNSATSNKHTEANTPVITNPPLPANGDPYDGWSTYTDPIERFTFRYPPRWQLHRVDVTDRDGKFHHTVELEGPDNFFLSYDIMRPDQPYNKGCKSCMLTKVELLRPPNFPNQLYLVIATNLQNQLPLQTLSISNYDTITQQDSTAYAYYPSIINLGYIVKWDGSYRKYATDGSNVLFFELKTFRAKPEVAIAKLILESVTY